MIITCNKCNTSYNLDENLLNSTGSKVRCSRCRNIFIAYPLQLADEAEPSAESIQEAIVEQNFQETEFEKEEKQPKEQNLTTEDLSQVEDSELEDSSLPLNEDLDSLGFDIEDSPAVEDEEKKDEIQKDLNNLDIEETPEATELDLPDFDDDNLSLDEDLTSLELDIDGTLAEENNDNISTEAEVDEIIPDELEDLNLGLEFEEEPSQTDKQEPDDNILEEAKKDETALDELENLELELELEEDPSQTKQTESDEFDLSDLENILENEEQLDGLDEDDLNEELELDLDLSIDETSTDLTSEPDQISSRLEDDEENLEDLEFDLDMEFEEKQIIADDLDDKLDIAEPDVAELDDDLDLDNIDESGEIDLSEIEAMLDKDDESLETIPDDSQEELSLYSDSDSGVEKWASGQKEDAEGNIDISEIEAFLDQEDTDDFIEDTQDTGEEPELELEENAKTDNEDLLTSALAEDAKEVDPKESLDTGDIELEFEVDDEQEEPDDNSMESTMEFEPKTIEDEEEDLYPKPKPKKKKGLNKGLVFLLIIIALGAIAVGTYYVLNNMGIEVPYISNLIKPQTNDPGNLKLTTFNINSKFIDNQKIGKLFVITGKIKNEYSNPRSFIQVAGKLYAKGKALKASETVYCGNIISGLDLSNMDLPSIKKRLGNKNGDNQSNINIKPDKAVPFMVVFTKLPDELAEFTIEINQSSPAQKP